MKHFYSLKSFLFDATSFAYQHLTIICYSSLHLSSSVRFLQKYFDWVQAQAGTLTITDITELSISHSCCVLRVTVLLEGEPSEVLNALDWVFIKAISVFWCIELYFYSDESLSPCCWKTAPQHEQYQHTLLLGRYSACDEQCLLSFKHDA